MHLIRSNLSSKFLLFSFWIIVTAFNLTKAIHIDDSAHLEIAKAIQNDPWHPMSAQVNWINKTEAIHKLNQPHLFFYLLAAVMSVLNDSELILHLLISVFSLSAILFFYALSRIFTPRFAIILTAIFSLGPVFIPSQNVMVDIPLASLWLAFFWALLSKTGKSQTAGYILAAIFVSTACLIKYPSLILIPLLLIHIILNRRWQTLWVLSIPIVTLAGWSLFNYLDYGGIHILGRETPDFEFNRLIIKSSAWLICLGAISPFSIICIPYLWLQKNLRYFLFSCLMISVVVLGLGFFILDEPQNYSILRACFLGMGIMLLGLTFYSILSKLFSRDTDFISDEKIRYIILLMWLVGGAAFIILFAPNMAVRHLVIIIPAILLILGNSIVPKVTENWLFAGTAATIILGILLAVSDWKDRRN